MQLRLERTLGIAVVCAAIGNASHAQASSPADVAGTEPSSVIGRASAQTTTYADTDHVTVVTPVAIAEVADRAGRWKVRGQYLVDMISAASVDIVSTASQRWTEVRQAGTLAATYKPRDVGIQASAALSREPDYRSIAAAAHFLWDFGDKSHTAILGYALDHDTIGRTGTPFDVFSHTLFQHTIAGGVTLTLNRAMVLSLIGDFIVETGDQSKPYRYIPMFSADVAPSIAKGESISMVNALRLPERPLEQLPDSRERVALTARFGYRMEHSTIRVDERVYTDTWGLHATTTEARYFVDLSNRFTLWPRLRANVQNGVYFRDRAYVSTYGAGGWELPRYRTGDRELGPLVTIGGGVGASYGLGPEIAPSDWSLQIQADVMNTQFEDDLYIKSRTAGTAVVGLDGVFE